MFSGRYKALVVDGSGEGYVKTVCDYVHLNPVRSGLINLSFHDATRQNTGT